MNIVYIITVFIYKIYTLLCCHEYPLLCMHRVWCYQQCRERYMTSLCSLPLYLTVNMHDKKEYVINVSV